MIYTNTALKSLGMSSCFAVCSSGSSSSLEARVQAQESDYVARGFAHVAEIVPIAVTPTSTPEPANAARK